MTYATTWMNLENIIFNKISQTQKDTHCLISLTGGPYRNQIHRDRKEMVEPGAVAGGWGVSVSWGQSFCLGRWESSGDDGGDDCPTMWICLMPLKVVTMGNFMLCIFYRNKINRWVFNNDNNNKHWGGWVGRGSEGREGPLLNTISRSLSPGPRPPPSTSSLWISLLQGPPVSGTRQCLSFCVQLISPSIMSWGFICVAVGVRISFLFKDWITFHCMDGP